MMSEERERDEAIQRAVAHEREECAKAAEDVSCDIAAAAIRARGEAGR